MPGFQAAASGPDRPAPPCHRAPRRHTAKTPAPPATRFPGQKSHADLLGVAAHAADQPPFRGRLHPAAEKRDTGRSTFPTRRKPGSRDR